MSPHVVIVRLYLSHRVASLTVAPLARANVSFEVWVIWEWRAPHGAAILAAVVPKVSFAAHGKRSLKVPLI